jgi:hypothetical protein
MATTARPLAKALHTVTAVARVAKHLSATSPGASDEQLALAALFVLGYGMQQIDTAGDLFRACVKAVRA